MFNEFYAKDTSKKIRAVFKAKGQSGKPLCTNPPYGYKKDPDDKTHWIVDEKAAAVVKKIFHLCMSGYGPTQIAKELQKRRIETPVEYGKRMGVNVPSASQRENDDPCRWTTSTVVHILERREYTGCIVNFKGHKKSYKSKKRVKNAPSEWAIFEGAHEAIIEPEVYNTVQKIRDGRRRQTPMGEMPALSGMVWSTVPIAATSCTKSEAAACRRASTWYALPTVKREKRMPVTSNPQFGHRAASA